MKIKGPWPFRGPKALLLISLIVAFILGYWFRGGRPVETVDPKLPLPSQEQPQPQAHEHAVYVCPMMCVPPMENPGKCPVCGMELISVAAGNQEGGSPRLKLTEETIRLAQIQVAPVERKFVAVDVRLFGQIDFDPAHMSIVTAFMRGVINRVYVKRAGQFVRWGEPLFEIYSPDLLATQEQLIGVMQYVPSFLAFQGVAPHVAKDAPVQVRKSMETPGQRSPEAEEAFRVIEGVRNKLKLLGMPKRDIDEFMKVGEATGIAVVYAPMYGQVTKQSAFEGTYVNTGTPIFTIADPQFVWVKLEAYETDYPWIRKGQKVTFQADAYPGETFDGKVVFIDPVFDVKTRTFTVGVVCPDHGGRMKAGMVVRAAIRAQLSGDGKIVSDSTTDEQAPLVIPASAPLVTGKRAVVYVAVAGDEGVFEGREIVLGPKAGDHYLVVSGLNEGDQVVVNGNFKIDSAIQILAKSSMMKIEGVRSAIEHHHHGGSDLMHEDYWSERMKSRTDSMVGSESTKHEMLEGVHGGRRPDVQAPGHSTIQRRRPGTYGDTTRGAIR